MALTVPSVREPLKPTAAAIEHHLKGTAVEVEIDETGNVTAADALLGRYGTADDARSIESAVRGWKFTPATRDGKPVRVITDLIATFADAR